MDMQPADFADSRFAQMLGSAQAAKSVEANDTASFLTGEV
jgi:hypothetical protein